MALHLRDVSKQVKKEKKKKRVQVIHQVIIVQPVKQGLITESVCNALKCKRHTFSEILSMLQQRGLETTSGYC